MKLLPVLCGWNLAYVCRVFLNSHRNIAGVTKFKFLDIQLPSSAEPSNCSVTAQKARLAGGD